VLLPSFEYERPETVDEAVALLAATRNARVLAGGQTLLNALKLRIVHPDVLVDVSRLDALRGVEREPDGRIRIGAATTYDEVAASPLMRAAHPVTATMTSRIVDRQVRARGTIGGNVCLNDPTSNFPPLLVALDATLRLQGPAGVREVPADGFFLAPYMTALEPGELLRGVLLPALDADEGVGYQSLQVGTDSWALARACARVRCTADGTVAQARVALGCGPVPVRQPAMERALVGGPATPAAVTTAAQLAGEDFDPPTDVHATAAYRARMATAMARRAVLAAIEEAQHG
jgi:carbon-monoxide dehydrogenase medium subunit